MRSKDFLRVRALRKLVASLLVITAGFLVSAAAAKDGRDFAGTYSLTDIHEQGDQIQLTLNLELSNYTGTDLSEPVIEVRSHPAPGVLGTFGPIGIWRNGERIVVSRQLELQRSEYEKWSTNRPPSLFIVYKDHEGQTWTRAAQLNSRP